ncbi:hypothetical protein CLV56_0698 [Mumia flava]|uniref:GGDEF domain-containing protein n=1 Tax=Mumia flava TaxID=1348852 RepID=A0A0B2BNR9_9ACTN|nr:hypothetical protein [Mumia flava]PJJ56489.1 hypothetical protein CLV56_0698 [Mumia flava]
MTHIEDPLHRPDRRQASPASDGSEGLFGVPIRRLDALGETLASGGDLAGVAVELGATAATDGIGWSELLRDVEDVCRGVSGSLPPYELVREMSIAWTEAVLQHAHTLSCEDPLTGLATPAHLRTRLDEAYRVAEREGYDAGSRWVFVVAELPAGGGPEAGLLRSLSMLALSETMRTCFDADETIARVGERRAVTLVERESGTDRFGALKDLLDAAVDLPQVRLWVEGLPRGSESASRLLDELSR